MIYQIIILIFLNLVLFIGSLITASFISYKHMKIINFFEMMAKITLLIIISLVLIAMGILLFKLRLYF